MKKLLVAGTAAALMMLGASFAAAEPGPNGNNDHGLCTAYFNGQKNGHGEGEDPDGPQPFENLERRGEEHTDSDEEDNDFNGSMDAEDTEPPEHDELTDAENTWNYCSDGGLIGGNPDHGRFFCFDQSREDDPETDETEPIAHGEDPASSPECGTNEEPGGGNGKGKKP